MAAFQWPLSKLEIINSALSQCGDNLVNAADDGSDEWLTASPAYERALAVVCEDHGWSWLTSVRTLQPSPTAPTDDQYDTSYVLPADLVHLIWVRVNDRPTVWDLIDNKLAVNAQGGPPPPPLAVTPAPVTIKGIFSTLADPANATPTVVLALQHFVMSGIYRGLHEDTAEADKMMQFANQILERAKSRHDMQKPKRALFNSRMTATRRVPRPWPRTPPGWSGTGIPEG